LNFSRHFLGGQSLHIQIWGWIFLQIFFSHGVFRWHPKNGESCAKSKVRAALSTQHPSWPTFSRRFPFSTFPLDLRRLRDPDCKATEIEAHSKLFSCLKIKKFRLPKGVRGMLCWLVLWEGLIQCFITRESLSQRIFCRDNFDIRKLIRLIITFLNVHLMV